MEKKKYNYKSLESIIRDKHRRRFQQQRQIVDEGEEKGYELNIKDMYQPGKSHPSLKNNFYKITFNGQVKGDSRGYSKADAHREIDKMVNHPKNDGWFRKHKDLQEETLLEDNKLHQKAGYHAYPYKNCPHKKGTKEHKHWWKGYFNRELDNIAKEQLEEIIYKIDEIVDTTAGKKSVHYFLGTSQGAIPPKGTKDLSKVLKIQKKAPSTTLNATVKKEEEALEEIHKGHKVTAIGKREGEEHIKGGKVEKRFGNMVHFRTVDGKLYKAHHTQLVKHEQESLIKNYLEKSGTIKDKANKGMESMKKISKQQNPFSRGFKLKSIKKLGEGEFPMLKGFSDPTEGHPSTHYGPFKDLDYAAAVRAKHRKDGKIASIKTRGDRHFVIVKEKPKQS